MKKCITVSIVDDQTDVRESIAAYINQAKGFRCMTLYANAREAIAHLPTDNPDVLLMDINLGGMDGIECIRQLKPQLPSTQIVMLTVFENTEKIFKAISAGASGYLLKRLAPHNLLEAIREVHDGGSPISAPIARRVIESLQAQLPPKDQCPTLSGREKEVLDKLAEGFVYKEVAEQLGLSAYTVRNYVRRIYEKLHVRSNAAAVAKYLHG